MKNFALILAAAGKPDGSVDKGWCSGTTSLDRPRYRKNPPASQPYRHQCQPQSRILRPTQRARFSDARQWQHYGPLAALCTAANDLQIATADWLLIVSCDMPRLPENLVSQFETIAKRTPLCNAFYVETPSRPHYSVMFIRPQILQSTVPYLYSGMRSIRGWLQQQRARVVHFPHEQDFIQLQHGKRFDSAFVVG